MTDLNHLSAAEIVEAITSGNVSAEDVTRACLARIEEREAEVGAFEYLDPAYAIEQAKVLDDGPVRGHLHGVPIGVKDIMDTFDMPTGWGFEPYSGRTVGRDAGAVALCREAGAVILGKTVTSEFARLSPAQDPQSSQHGSHAGSLFDGGGSRCRRFHVSRRLRHPDR